MVHNSIRDYSLKGTEFRLLQSELGYFIDRSLYAVERAETSLGLHEHLYFCIFLLGYVRI